MLQPLERNISHGSFLCSDNCYILYACYSARVRITAHPSESGLSVFRPWRERVCLIINMGSEDHFRIRMALSVLVRRVDNWLMLFVTYKVCVLRCLLLRLKTALSLLFVWAQHICMCGCNECTAFERTYILCLYPRILHDCMT